MTILIDRDILTASKLQVEAECCSPHGVMLPTECQVVGLVGPRKREEDGRWRKPSQTLPGVNILSETVQISAFKAEEIIY